MQLSLADGSRESQLEGAAPQASHATLVEVTLSLSESQLQLEVQLPPNRTRRDACQKNIPRPT